MNNNYKKKMSNLRNMLLSRSSKWKVKVFYSSHSDILENNINNFFDELIKQGEYEIGLIIARIDTNEKTGKPVFLTQMFYRKIE